MTASPNFIEVYDQVLDPQLCEHLITQFNHHPDVYRGRTGHGVDIRKKDSYDLCITGLAEWTTLENIVLQATFAALRQYFKKYIFALVGAISPGLQNPKTQEVVTLTPENVHDFGEETFDAVIQTLYRRDVLKIQKYLKGEGGYHHWHSEIYPDPHNKEEPTLHRVLLFQYYLNTVEQGGETEFYYQNLKIKPQQGRLIIAPGGFTHTHKGHIPMSGDKYILTSWILFQQAEVVYGQSRG